MIDVPQIFVEFATWFHQDTLLIYHSLQQAIVAFAASANEADKCDLAQYVANLRETRLTADEFNRLWTTAGSQLYFENDASVNEFLKTILDTVHCGGT
jgi:hypothetical protein